MTSTPCRGSNVVSDIPAEFAEGRRQSMADPDPTQEFVSLDPPELGIGDEFGRPRRFLKALGDDLLGERLEAWLARPRCTTIAQVVADHGVVIARPTTFREEFVHRGDE
jgi:hypothetical protein